MSVARNNHYVPQKITYSAGDSNALIRDLRTEKDFRIAVTVTLVATGTDVRPPVLQSSVVERKQRI